MALTTVTVGDYYNLGWNMVAVKPKSGYTAAVGHLLQRENAAANEVDLIGANENPSLMVESINSSNGTITAALLVPGTVLILQTTGAVALGDKIEGTATALGSTIARTVVQTDNTNGVGRVIALNPAGTDTAAVLF